MNIADQILTNPAIRVAVCGIAGEVCQALTQAKDDGERMERRIQDLGEEANNLEERLDDAENEIVRLKIAHLRRMAERADCLRSGWTKMAGFAWASRRAAALDRFRSACLAKIIELKESQCSTKS